MSWQIIVALVVSIPIILLPMLVVWYLNIGGMLSAAKEANAKQATQKQTVKAAVKAD